jgi:hypothetical protein
MALLGAEFLDGASTWDQKERKNPNKSDVRVLKWVWAIEFERRER